MILIGTIHTDLEGLRRLDTLLEFYQPKKITLEIPKAKSIDKTIELFRKINKEMQELANNADISDNLKQFAKKIFETVGYELFVTANYCKKTGAELYFVDLPELTEMSGSTHIIPYLNVLEAALKQNPKIAEIPYQKLTQTHQRIIDKTYRKIAELYKYFEGGTSLIKNTPDLNKNDIKELNDYLSEVVSKLLSENREQFMANEILQRNPDMNIGGLLHINSEFRSELKYLPLYKRLGSAAHKVILLCEADAIFKTKNQNI